MAKTLREPCPNIAELDRLSNQCDALLGEIDSLKRDVFRVKQFEDTKASPLVVRYGTCYSFFDHFDIHWDDGDHQMDVAELSVFGIYKDSSDE